MLLLSRDEAYSRRTHVTVCPITRKARRLRTEVRLTRADGMPQDSVANLDDIQTISLSLLDRRIAVLGDIRLSEIRVAIFYALAL